MIAPFSYRKSSRACLAWVTSFSLALLASVSGAQQSSPPVQQTDPPTPTLIDGEAVPDAVVASDGEGREMIQLALPQKLEVKTLVEYVSRRLNVNIQYDEAIAKKHITLLAPALVPKDSLLDLLRSVLKMSGLALVEAEQDGWLKVVTVADVSSAVLPETDPERLEDVSSITIVSQMFQLENISTATAQRTIQPFLSQPGGNILPMADIDLLIVTDYAGRMRQIVDLIAQLDVPGPEPTMVFIAIEHMDAAQLARQASDLLAQKRSLRAAGAPPPTAGTIIAHELRTNQVIVISPGPVDQEALDLIAAIDVPSDAITRKYYLQYVSPVRIEQLVQKLISTEETTTQFRSATDVESGLLIVSAPERIHLQIVSLTEQLDVADTADQQGHMQFYPLMNATATDVLATIRSMESGGMALEDMASTEYGLDDAFPGHIVPNTPPIGLGNGRPAESVYVTPIFDDDTSLDDPAGGRARAVQTNNAVVTADLNSNTIIVVAPPPVQKLYERLILMLDKRQPQVLIEVTLVTIDTSNGRSLGVEVSRKFNADGEKSALTFSAFGLSDIDQDTGILTLTPGIGFNGVMVNADLFNIVVRALASSGQASVLSAPKVLVNNNATATLSSVSEAPFARFNTAENASTTTFGGYASAGTTVTVTPHISEDDYLQLDYTITLNSFSGEGSEALPPPRQTNTLNSKVTIPDGYAIIVGGLTRKGDSKTSSAVPGLGELPILKYLFGVHSQNTSESTLFAFIRPVILRDDEFDDLKYLSARDLEAAGQPPHFPVSEPMTMQ